jgi:hypothetical protein
VVGTENTNSRLGRVEAEADGMRSEMGGIKAEMSGIKSDVSGLKSDVKAFGGILSRIEQGVARNQERSEEKESQGRPSLVAMISVLITLISIIVGGAWVISGSLARQDASITRADQTAAVLVAVRDREVDQLKTRIDRNEEHIWDNRRAPSSTGSAKQDSLTP